jgi:hypothetical protein
MSKLVPGRYLIIKRAFWMREESDIIIIDYIEDEDVFYLYLDEIEKRKHNRVRSLYDFEEANLVPSCELLELLD